MFVLHIAVLIQWYADVWARVSLYELLVVWIGNFG